MGYRSRVLRPALGTLAAVLLATFSPTPASPQSPPPGVIKLAYRVQDSQYDPDGELRLLDLLNQTRLQAGLRPLMMGGSLRFVARAHSRDMAIHGYFGHESFGGESFIDRMVGIVRGGTFVGENVTIVGTVEEAHAAFCASPDHLRNMLDPRFTQIGIGVATAGDLGLAVTEDFSE
ncbi:MAG TPA: CAP domain-containing protein [bacterium]|nr:CAP domain-containing protein [bacterium]